MAHEAVVGELGDDHHVDHVFDPGPGHGLGRHDGDFTKGFSEPN